MKHPTGIRVRTVREMLNISQQFVANRLGISQAAYSYLESGRIRIDDAKLQGIARALNVKQDMLMKFDLNKVIGQMLVQKQRSSASRKQGVPSVMRRKK